MAEWVQEFGTVDVFLIYSSGTWVHNMGLEKGEVSLCMAGQSAILFWLCAVESIEGLFV